MVEDDKLRSNRLNLLAALKNSFNRLADFSKLQAP
jgi:glycyl-tRNA synthetase beta subunit